MQYQANGNIGFKTDAGNYSYDLTKKNAVTQVSNQQSNISSNVQDITYTPFNSVSTIVENNNELIFTYAADQQRRKMEHKLGGITQKTTYYFGNYEKIVNEINGDVTELHYIGGGDGLAAIYVIQTPLSGGAGVGNLYYTYTDHLGSILTLTDEDANIIYEQNFDAWGRERNPDTWDYTDATAMGTVAGFKWLTRGYTGHEHLPSLSGGAGGGSLINMNGRLYDPILGRMLSPDNYVQSPFSSQSYNRYSYVINNPLKYTDPSGEFFGLDLAMSVINGIGGAVSSGAFVQPIMTVGQIFAMVGIAYVSAATGAAVFSSFGVSATVGFNLYTFTAGVAGGATSGFVGGFSSAILGGSSLNNALLGGLQGALIGGLIGGVTAGIAGGINAQNNHLDFFKGLKDPTHGALASIGDDPVMIVTLKQFELIDYAIDPLNIKTVTAFAGASTNLFYHSTFSFIRDGQTRQGDMDIIIRAGQKIKMDFINHNLLGATISVNNVIGSEKTWLGAIVDKQITKNIILLPTQTKSIEFSNFGNEPMQWKFSIGTISEATNISINIYSTWVPGMPSNPPLIPRLTFPFIPIKP